MSEVAFAAVTADLSRIYNEATLRRGMSGLTGDDVQRWTALMNVTPPELYDRIAIYLANGFHEGELSFRFCDAVVNHLHGVIILSGGSWPELFWKIFLAFETGESYRRDKPHEDPVATYARPLIAEIVAEYRRGL